MSECAWKEQDMVQRLQKFIHEVGKKEAHFSVRLCYIQSLRSSTSHKYPKVNFFTEIKYRKTNESLGTAIKISSKEIVRVLKKNAKMITLAEKAELLEKGYLRSDTLTQIISQHIILLQWSTFRYSGR